AGSSSPCHSCRWCEIGANPERKRGGQPTPSLALGVRRETGRIDLSFGRVVGFRPARTEARMVILDELTDGPGFCLEELTPTELEHVRGLIAAPYLERLGRLPPAL